MKAALSIRRYQENDFDDLVSRWHQTNLVSYRYVAEQQKHSADDARHFFRTTLLAACQVWVATAADDLVGMIALEVPWIRHFAVFPGFQRRGVGSALLEKAQECSPRELRLFTFQRNEAARAFYAKHDFIAVAFGISPAPESEPDVEYRRVA
jgi:ribosomal protein S18 acetylase RimI-like enzyme